MLDCSWLTSSPGPWRGRVIPTLLWPKRSEATERRSGPIDGRIRFGSAISSPTSFVRSAASVAPPIGRILTRIPDEMVVSCRQRGLIVLLGCPPRLEH
jgi:hypothetical protein